MKETDQLVSDDPTVFGGRTVNISAPPSDPDGRREQMQILANTASAASPLQSYSHHPRRAVSGSS